MYLYRNESWSSDVTVLWYISKSGLSSSLNRKCCMPVKCHGLILGGPPFISKLKSVACSTMNGVVKS